MQFIGSSRLRDPAGLLRTAVRLGSQVDVSRKNISFARKMYTSHPCKNDENSVSFLADVSQMIGHNIKV
jgi:hypothetical protein